MTQVSGTVESRVPAKKSSLLFILCVFLIVLGLLCVIFGSINLDYEEEQTRELERVGVVIDAGGSGTRLISYEYKDGKINQVKYVKCEGKGLARYSQSEFPMLKTKLSDCFTDASMNFPKDKKVPIYFAATAGMRLLEHRDESTYDALWQLVRQCLDESVFVPKKVETISGFDEAKWAWIAANYLMKNLKSDDEKFGTIDFGSASLQIAFGLKGKVKESENVRTITIDGNETTIYGNSYLCFGNDEMHRRHLAKLVKESGYTRVVENPCYFNGYSKNVTSEYLWKAPCCSGAYARDHLGEEITGAPGNTYTLKGTGNIDNCSKIFTDLINVKCSNSSCGMNNQFQPKVEGTFLALSTFYYIGQTLEMTENSTKDDFLNAAKDLCSLSWEEMQNKFKGQSYLDGRCFQAVYGYYLLANGFKFDKETWKMEFLRKIDGKKIGWSLGLMFQNKDDMYSLKAYTMVLVQKPGFIALIILGVVCIVAFIVLTLFLFKRRSATDSSGKAEDPNV